MFVHISRARIKPRYEAFYDQSCRCWFVVGVRILPAVYRENKQ